MKATANLQVPHDDAPFSLHGMQTPHKYAYTHNMHIFRSSLSTSGGANVPALNDLLAPFGVAFGDALLVGTLNAAGEVLCRGPALPEAPCVGACTGEKKERTWRGSKQASMQAEHKLQTPGTEGAYLCSSA
eukprot:1039426-Pelagomonas_calceolata.AAC.3